MGKHTTRTPEIVQAVLDGMAEEGLSLRESCAKAGVANSTFMTWVAADPDLSEQYARALQEGVELTRDNGIKVVSAPPETDGWPKFCRTESKDLGYLQHRFCESYRAYAARGMQSGEYPRRLGGDRSPDHDYTRRGLPLPRPAVVGDKERAKLTYQNGGASGKTQISTNTSLVALASTVIAGVLDGSGRKEVA